MGRAGPGQTQAIQRHGRTQQVHDPSLLARRRPAGQPGLAAGCGDQPVPLGPGEPQALRLPGDLGRRFREQRAQSQKSVGARAFQYLDLEQSFEAGQVAGVRQDVRQNARGRHQPDGGPRIRSVQEGQELLQDPLGGQGGQAARLAGAGGRSGGVRLPAPVAGQETEIAEDAQMILGDPAVSLADKGDPALPGRRQPLAGRIEDPAPAVGVEGVEGEIPPGRILGPVGGEGHDRTAAIGLHIPPQGGDFEAAPAADGGDRAVVQPGRDGLQPGGLEGGDHSRRFQARRQVDVGDGAAHDGVANAAADKADAVRTSGRLQGVEYGGGGRILQPGRALKHEIRGRTAHAGAPKRRWDRTLSIPAVAPQMNRSSWVMA